MLSRVVAIIRILIGLAFLAAGIVKLMDPTLLYGGLLLELSEHGKPYYFYDRYFLGRFVMRHQELFAYAVGIGGILLGVSFLTGTLVSLAALGGAFMVVNLGLAVSAGKPLLMALHVLLALVFLVLGRYGAGLTWGGDGWLARRINEVLVLFPLRFSLPGYFTSDDPRK